MHRLLTVGLAFSLLVPAIGRDGEPDLDLAPSSVESFDETAEVPGPDRAERGARVAASPTIRLPISQVWVPLISAAAEPPTEPLRDLREDVRRDTPGRDVPRLSAGEPYH